MGGHSNNGPTLQQQQLETQQAVTNANLNIEENAQRKAILNAMQGTRVFRGSALSRALTGNDPGVPGGPSRAQLANSRASPFVRGQKSLFDVGGAGAQATTTVGPASSTGGYGIGGSFGGGARGPNSKGIIP